MRILFLHDNFPAQFGAFAQYLSQQGWEAIFGTQRENVGLKNVKTFTYKPHRAPSAQTHRYIRSFERATLCGQAVARSLLALEKRKIRPDIVMAHSGWGPGLFVKDIWPGVSFAAYFEWFYRTDGADIAYLSGEGDDRGLDDVLTGQLRNAPILSDLGNCDGAICPTQFQKNQFPKKFHDQLTVLHDGIDTEYFSPNDEKSSLRKQFQLPSSAKVITYVARGMEPYRGFPEFIRGLEIIQQENVNAYAIVVGEDRVAYGRKLPPGESYKKKVLAECSLDKDRIIFTGLLSRDQYRNVLLLSDVHVYFTIPFVLSWSMLEAMSAGCAIVASETEPVLEIDRQRDNCLKLVDHLNIENVAATVLELLSDQAAAKKLGRNARQLILEKYDRRELFAKKERWLSALYESRNA